MICVLWLFSPFAAAQEPPPIPTEADPVPEEGAPPTTQVDPKPVPADPAEGAAEGAADTASAETAPDVDDAVPLAVPIEDAPPAATPVDAVQASPVAAADPLGPLTPFEPAPQPLMYEVSLELGSFANPDPGFALFSDGNALPSYGIRVGYRIADRVQIVAAWHRASRGAVVEIYDTSQGSSDFDASTQTFSAALTTDQVTLGPRIDIDIEDVFLPYVTAQVLAMRGVARLDDDPTSTTNPGQIREGGMGLGAIVMGGAEVRMPIGAPMRFALHLEFGRGWVSPIALGTFGPMKPGGLVARGGVGVRF